MTWIAGTASADKSPTFHAAISLAPQIAAAGDEIEQARRIPPSIAKAMKDAGIFGMAMPRAWNGPGARPVDAVPRDRDIGHGRRISRLVRYDRLRQRLSQRIS